MSLNIKPISDRVVIAPLAAETTTASGIIIPDTHTEKPSQGKIIAVGSGYRNTDGSIRNLDVKVGDTVLFGKYSGTEVKVEGKPVLIMKEDEILGILH